MASGRGGETRPLAFTLTVERRRSDSRASYVVVIIIVVVVALIFGSSSWVADGWKAFWVSGVFCVSVGKVVEQICISRDGMACVRQIVEKIAEIVVGEELMMQNVTVSVVRALGGVWCLVLCGVRDAGADSRGRQSASWG